MIVLKQFYNERGGLLLFEIFVCGEAAFLVIGDAADYVDFGFFVEAPLPDFHASEGDSALDAKEVVEVVGVAVGF